jgi:hypothetical protein
MGLGQLLLPQRAILLILFASISWLCTPELASVFLLGSQVSLSLNFLREQQPLGLPTSAHSNSLLAGCLSGNVVREGLHTSWQLHIFTTIIGSKQEMPNESSQHGKQCLISTHKYTE